MSLARSALSIARKARTFATTPAFRMTKQPIDTVRPGYRELKIKAEKFNVDDDVPVHLKGGKRDVILYQLTVILCGVAVLWDIEAIYELIYT